MKKSVVKSLSFVLSLIMLLTAFGAFTASAEVATKEKYINGVYYTYTVKDGSVKIINAALSGNSAPKTLKIPSKIEGKPVTEVERVGMEEKNTKTTALVFPASVKKIGGLMSPDYYAFFNITNLASVTIGKNVKTINYNPFCGSLKKITVAKGNKYFSAKDGVLYNKKKTKLVAYPASKSGKSFTLPKSVKKIGAYAFYNAKKLRTVNTNRANAASRSAFEGGEIVTIKLGAPMKSFTGAAICHSEKLKTITVAKGNKYLTVKDGVLYNKKKTRVLYYPYTKKGTKYSVFKTVTAVGAFAFCGARLKKITLPDKVTQIGESAFEFCEAEVNLPASVKTVGKYAFSGSGIKDGVFPASLTKLGEGAFSCSGITSLDMSKTSVKTIPEDAFSECAYIETVTLPDCLETIEARAFYGCWNETLEVPASVRYIGSNAFHSFYLKTLIIRSTDAEIDDEAVSDTDLECNPNPIVIKGPAGSTAEAYAAAKGFTFELLSEA
ncbi:MAG: leucine-rich repeat domain-containing protein [Eubacterium sp.]|nr:leucine-rich repeat domain-containing protein [Eubacterium sp.]